MLLWVTIAAIPIVIFLYFSQQERNISNTIGIGYIILISIIGGLRFQTGDDWAGYTEYFSAIAITLTPLDAYNASVSMNVEPGFFLLCYIIKYIGGSINNIFLIASLFCGYAVVKFKKIHDVDIAYCAILYLGFPFLLLHFNEVRQSLALSFILLSIMEYITSKRIFIVILFFILAPCFHYSSVAYIAIFLMSQIAKKSNFEPWIFSFSILLITSFFLFKIDPFGILIHLLPEKFELKILLYAEDKIELGAGRHLITMMLVFVFTYIFKLKKIFRDSESAFFSILNITQFSIIITILAIYIFPNSYTFFNRMFLFTWILISVSTSVKILDLNFKMLSHFNVITKSILILFSLIFYARIILLYPEAWIPYRSYLFN